MSPQSNYGVRIVSPRHSAFAKSFKGCQEPRHCGTRDCGTDSPPCWISISQLSSGDHFRLLSLHSSCQPSDLWSEELEGGSSRTPSGPLSIATMTGSAQRKVGRAAGVCVLGGSPLTEYVCSNWMEMRRLIRTCGPLRDSYAKRARVTDHDAGLSVC
jgi:hypothetical protein